jgi:hypothetical protein
MITLARHIIFLLCIVTVVIAAVVTKALQHSESADPHLRQVLFCALCFLAGSGVIAFALQFFMKWVGHILTCMFFGFFAGIMATNFISEVASGTTFSSLPVYLASYGLMIFFFGLSVVGLILLWRAEVWQIADAAPNGGSANRLGNRRVTERRYR